MNPYFSRHTTTLAVLLALCVSLLALLTWLFLPRHLEQEAIRSAAARAEQIGLATAYNAGEGLQLEHREHIETAFDAARQNHDLYYLVITDGAGQIKGAMNILGANHARFDEVTHDRQAARRGVLYKTSLPVQTRDGGTGHLYMGLSLSSYKAAFGRLRWMARGFSLMLCLVAVALVMGARRMQHLEASHRDAATDHAQLHAENARLLSQLNTYEQYQYERRVREGQRPLNLKSEPAYQDLEQKVAAYQEAEHVLRQRAARWQNLVEDHPLPILIVRAGRIIYTNQAGVRVLGADGAARVRGTAVVDYIAPRQREAFLDQIARAALGEATPSTAYHLYPLDQGERFVEAAAGPATHGGQPAVQVVLHDVTERQTHETALRRFTERLQALNEIGHDLLADRPAQVIAQQALQHLKHLVPHTCASVVEYDQAAGEGVVLAIQTAGPSSLAAHARVPLSLFEHPHSAHPDQIHYVADLRARRLRSGAEQALLEEGIRAYFHVPLVVAGTVVGTLNVGTNQPDGFSPEQIELTSQVADLLAARIQQNRREQERVRYEQALIAAKEEAEEMARLNSVFLTHMSHEIRTPLSSIIGFAQILHEEVTGEHREFAQLIEDGAVRLLGTINSVLDLARLKSDGLSYSAEPLNVALQVRQAVRLLASLADRKALSLTFRSEAEDAWSRIDRASLVRVVNNLVGNAIKFTHEGSIEVAVEADGTHVYLRVQDTGIGISSAFLPYLFDEFRREEHGLGSDYEGSGLGMTITKRLIDRMGGALSVESEKGQGSCFTVCFPRLTDAGDDDAAAAEADQPQVLIVEDKEDAQYLLEFLLRGTVSTDLAPDTDIALRLARRYRYDAVLIDIALQDEPVTADHLTRLRTLPGYHNVPLLAMATQLLPPSWDAFLDMGFDGYISNPFVKDTLLTAVLHAIEAGDV